MPKQTKAILIESTNIIECLEAVEESREDNALLGF